MGLFLKGILTLYKMIIKVSPDIEKAKSIKSLIGDRENFVETINIDKFSTIAAENYYEIIKELATAILLIEGFKSVGEDAHKELINYLSNYKKFSEEEIFLMQDLRIKRNKSSYEGKQINKEYVIYRKERFRGIIHKLKEILNEKLK